MMSRFFIFVIIIVVFSGCYKDVDNSTTENYPEAPTTIINTKLVGTLEDNAENLIENYSLLVAGESSIVESKYYTLNLNQISKYDQTIWAIQNDEVISMAHRPLQENDINEITFKSFSNWTKKTIEQNQDLELTTGALLSIDFSKYTETTTSIETRTITKSDNLVTHGYNETNQLMSLSNVTILDVQISLSNIIPESVRLVIANDRSLYKLDNTKDKWLKVITDSKEAYISESGYYLLATDQEGVKASGTIEKSGQLISFQYYKSSANKLLKSTALGNWIDILPSQSSVEIEIINPCLENVGSQSLQTTDQDINEVISVGPELLLQEIETTIINCLGNEVDDSAIVIAEEGKEFIYLFGSSSIMATVPVCNNEFTIAAYDINADEQGLSFPWKKNIGDEIAFLNTCSNLSDGYSFFKINNDPKIYSAFNFELQDGNITLTSNSNDPELKLVLGGDGKGSYDEVDVNIKIYDEDFGANGYAVNCEESPLGCGIDDLFVSHLNDNDDWVRISFTGNIWMQTIDPLAAGTYPIEAIIICKAQ